MVLLMIIGKIKIIDHLALIPKKYERPYYHDTDAYIIYHIIMF